MSIHVHELLKTYGHQKAVNSISFEAKKGEVLGFLGPNGAGKSTTMKIATGYIAPTSGSVRICDIDIQQQALEAKQLIGYLPEHNPLYLSLYVKEYIAFVGGLYGLKGKYLRQRVNEMIDLCGLGVEQHKKISALSKGYRQRIGLAQALIHNPEVLILDEPTTGLDPNQIIEIRKLIKNVSQDKTVIFSTHIMQEVQALCDQVIIINKGTIVANDNVARLKELNKGETHLNVVFEKGIDQVLLSQIEGIKAIHKITETEFTIITESSKSIRSEIVKLATHKEWGLIGITAEESSLEEVFQHLTK